MTRDPLPPIPVPPALRWREFRVRVLPVLIFVAALLGIVFLWRKNVSAPMFTGTVESRTAQVISPRLGRILHLYVQPFQVVTQGMPVAVLESTDPRLALSAVSAELDLIRSQLDPYLTRLRNETDFEQLRIRWLEQRVSLTSAQVNSELANDQLRRNESLHQQKLISDDEFEIFQKAAEALSAEVYERSNLVSLTAESLKHLENHTSTMLTNELVMALTAALQKEEQKLHAAAEDLKPITLVAPMDGMIGRVLHQAGEMVPEGTPLLTLSGTEPERIVAYLRQPLPFEPKVGARVDVRTRTLQRQTSTARINSVGARFEPIAPVLTLPRPGNMAEDFGLPVEITLPPGLQLRPGEILDLTYVGNR